MSPTVTRKGNHVLSSNTKRARFNAVRKLAVRVHGIQLESADLESGTDGSSSSGTKYGVIKKLIKEAENIYTWIDRSKVDNAVRLIKKRHAKTLAASRVLQFPRPTINEQSNDGDASRKPGQPKGSTGLAKLDLKEKRKIAIDLVATRYSQAKRSNGGKVPLGSFQKIRDEVLKELIIEDENVSINQGTILSRIRRNSLLVDRPGARSPMEKVEPVILKFALWKQEAGQPISSGEGIQLATSLIKGTPIEKEVQAFQKSRHGKSTSWCLTNMYWRLGFMKRNAASLSRAKGNRIAACRAEWTTFENISEMYNLVYDQMVDAGLAKKLSAEDQFWTNHHGIRVETEAEAF